MQILKKFWWVAALQGLILIFTGVLAITNSNIYLQDLVEYLALTFLVFGAILLTSGGLLRKRSKDWWVLFFTGILELGLGLTVLFSPAESTRYFTMAIAIFAALMGGLQLGYALFRASNRIFNAINGLLSLAFAAMIYWNPFESFRALTYLVAFYSLILGLLIIVYAMKLRAWAAPKKQLKPTGESHPKETPSDPDAPSPPEA